MDLNYSLEEEKFEDYIINTSYTIFSKKEKIEKQTKNLKNVQIRNLLNEIVKWSPDIQYNKKENIMNKYIANEVD